MVTVVPLTAMPKIWFISELVARPPSPEKPQVWFPPTVLIFPVDFVTSRITQLPVSAMNTLPLLSAATPEVVDNSALTAEPPSPEKPQVWFPAEVVIVFVESTSLRTTQLFPSPMKRFPELSAPTPCG